MNKIKEIIEKLTKKSIPNVRPGDTVKVFQKIKDGKKERIQVFEGTVLGKKHRDEVGATITVRKVSKGVAVERIFPLHSPLIQKIEVIKRSKVRRAKLYFLRTAKGQRARLKRKEFDQEEVNKVEEVVEEKEEEKPLEEIKEVENEKESPETTEEKSPDTIEDKEIKSSAEEKPETTEEKEEVKKEEV